MSIKKDLRNVPKTFDLGLLDLFDQFPRCPDENVIILDDISFSDTEFDALELGELTSSVNNEYDDVELSDYDVKDIEDMNIKQTREIHACILFLIQSNSSLLSKEKHFIQSK